MGRLEGSREGADGEGEAGISVAVDRLDSRGLGDLRIFVHLFRFRVVWILLSFCVPRGNSLGMLLALRCMVGQWNVV